MIEEYIMEKFIERVNVLIYGYGQKLVSNKLSEFLDVMCDIPFRSNVNFELNYVQDDSIVMSCFIDKKSIPFIVDKSVLKCFDNKKIPYRLSEYEDKIEIELASKINNIMFREINMLDLYDIYMYFTFRNNEIDEEILLNNLDKVNNNLVKYVDKPSVRDEWSKYKTSVNVSFDNILLVLEKIVNLSEK